MAPGSMWTTMWDDISKTPYAVNGDKWISYDDEHSVAEKVILPGPFDKKAPINIFFYISG